MYDLLSGGARTVRQPWARLLAEGHGRPWRVAADWNDLHQERWKHTLTAEPHP